MQNKKDVVRWGVIGLGRLVVTQIAPAIVNSSHSKLMACVGSTLEKTHAFAQTFGVERCYRNIRELVADPEIEAVFIATPNAEHHSMVITAARARKNILCEKPFALSVEDGRQMIAECNAAGVILRVAFQIRLEEILRRVRKIVNSGALGELRSIMFERIAPLRQQGTWRRDPQQGGVLFDVAVHLFDQVEWLTDLKLYEVSAYSHPDRRLGVADDTVTILGMLGTNCHVVVRASREIPYAENDLRMLGTKGLLNTSALRWADEYVLRLRTEVGIAEERFAPTAIYSCEIEAFAHEVRGGPQILACGEDGLRAIEITSAVLESIQSRCSVKL